MTQLILIPGLAGDAQMWQSQLPVLPTALKPVVTDVHQCHTTLDDMAQALLAEHAGDLILCGASMGGIIAMEAVRRAPERIRALALLGTTARPETDEMRALRESAVVLFARGRANEVIEPNVAFAFHPLQAANEALVQSYLDFVLRAGAYQLIRQNQAIMARPDARLHLPLIRCPTLVMRGDADQLTPPECSHEIAALIPGAELVMVPQCGHMLTMEHPATVNATLLAWLARLGWRA